MHPAPAEIDNNINEDQLSFDNTSLSDPGEPA